MTSESDKVKTIMTRNEVEICYETFGDRGGPPLVLIIAGHADERLAEPFCRKKKVENHFSIGDKSQEKVCPLSY
ncbi:hypothetical protein [Desulfopila inferna]|uniref:hypothetical protein n=1 Tax=Desulfopila inferna TaxID=468528 RepID=UPI0019631BA0|nr:hypothetical protein [Desulfopila inferna]MBM9605327.1 hypothetical protein [Desulfopila inferna]